jgi:hypothetical protein
MHCGQTNSLYKFRHCDPCELWFCLKKQVNIKHTTQKHNYMVALQYTNIQLVCSTNKQLKRRAMEYCVNITIDHYISGMWQVHTQCDSHM